MTNRLWIPSIALICISLSGCFGDLFNNDSGYICIAGINCGEVNEDAEYATLEECQTCLTNLDLHSCGTDGCYSSAVGTYTSLLECELACGGNGTSGYNCAGGNCQQVSSGASYSSLSACQSACGGTGGYDCENGNCQQVSDGGAFANLAACQSACGGGTYTGTPGSGVTDVDGNSYGSTVLGNGQEWMTSNLRTSKYANGDEIPNVTGNYSWQVDHGQAEPPVGACASINHQPSNDAAYGKVYNGAAVKDNRGLCPSGWHVPTNAEWEAMVSYIDADAVNLGQTGNSTISYAAGGVLKATGTQLWDSPNNNATDGVGFRAVANGQRSFSGDFMEQGTHGFLWSSSNSGPTTLNRYFMFNATANFGRTSGHYAYGSCVRCIKD
jgi:uncharacterized protein (TIGR02145 family)